MYILSHSFASVISIYPRINRDALKSSSKLETVYEKYSTDVKAENKRFKIVPHDTGKCLACAVIDYTKTSRFGNRGELLQDPGKVTNTELKKKLEKIQTLLLQSSNSSQTQLEKQQLAAAIMPLMKTVDYDAVHVIILAQCIEDAPNGSSRMMNWTGDGYEGAISSQPDKDKALYKAGFRRDKNTVLFDDKVEDELFKTSSQTQPRIKKIYAPADHKEGEYNLGADKITGEAKLIVTLVRDPVHKKWKVIRMHYDE